MLSIRTVLCPVDLSPSTARQVDLATDVCRAFGARLVLHHNRIELAIGSGVGWMWEPGHAGAALTAEAHLQHLRAALPGDLDVDVQVTHGPVVDAVRAVGHAVRADLVVLRARGEESDGDDSVTDRLLESASMPILAVHDAVHDHRPLRFTGTTDSPQTLLVPIDLGPASPHAADVAFELSRRFGFAVHLLHVLPAGAANGAAADEARAMLTALAPADLSTRIYPHVETGVAARAIVRLANDISAACIVMGEHAQAVTRHWFRSGTSRAVLHPSSCPIWYVPHREPAAAEPSVETDRRSLVAELQDTTFRFWPSSYLQGVVDSIEDAESALSAIITAGVPRDQLHTWFGPEGSAAIDPSGRHHGRMARLWRLLEKATPERDLLEQYASEVDAGRVCIGGHIDSPEGARVMAEILKQHGGRLISYFSVGAVQHLH